MITHKQLKIKLETIKDPTTNKTLKELNAIKRVLIEPDGVVNIKLEYPSDGSDFRKLKRDIARLVKIDLNFKGLKIEKVSSDKKIKYNYLAILSAKGGVGKSTITSELAKALTKCGIKVGIIDSDIYGASIPDYFNIEDKKVYGNDDKIAPVMISNGIEVVSARFLIDENQSVVLRSPVLRGVLDYFFNKVAWSIDNEIILIDMPPGTGDILMDVFDYTKGDLNSLLITTPDINASKIALKSGIAVNDLGGKVLGIIENMSYLLKTKKSIFGSGGGEYVAKTLKIPLLAKIPIGDIKKKELDDIFLKLAKKIMKMVGLKNV